MSIPLPLLTDTDSRAVGFAVYGGPGNHKTLGIRTLPPPIMCCEFEGGTGGLTPWIRRKRRSDSSKWIEYTQDQREHAFKLTNREMYKFINPDNGMEVTQEVAFEYGIEVRPAPLIDLVSFDPMRAVSYTEFTELLGGFDTRMYSSYALDATAEFSQTTQSYAKFLKWGVAKEFEPMLLDMWQGAQERAGIQVRRIRAMRDSGVFVYVTGGEEIDKEYAQDPRSLSKSEKTKLAGDVPQPYAIIGSIQLPGKLVGLVTHAVDNLFRARQLNGRSTWIAVKESMPGGDIYWNAKDRWGRLPAYNPPNFKRILTSIYGKDGARAIYGHNTSTNITTPTPPPTTHPNPPTEPT